MSQENVELVRRGFDAINTYRGLEGYRSWFEQQRETYDHISSEVHDIRAVGDQVVALYTTRVRGAHSGIELEAAGGTVFTLRDGLVVRQAGYQRPVDALAAAGLAE